MIARSLVIALLIATIHFCHTKAEVILASEKTLEPDLLVPNYESVRLVAMGFDKLLADYYWLSFISYYGDSAGRDKDNYALADRYLDLITSLDPQFVQPYWFVAFAVGEEQGNPRKAAEILKKGVDANQNNWYLPFIAGFNQYMFAGDEISAAKYYRMASKYPGAPLWLGRQAKILEAKIPSLVKRINTWSDVYNSVDEPGLKEKAREELQRLWIEVYRRSPSNKIKKRAIDALKAIGVNAGLISNMESRINGLDK